MPSATPGRKASFTLEKTDAAYDKVHSNNHSAQRTIFQHLELHHALILHIMVVDKELNRCRSLQSRFTTNSPVLSLNKLASDIPRRQYSQTVRHTFPNVVTGNHSVGTTFSQLNVLRLLTNSTSLYETAKMLHDGEQPSFEPTGD
jgi:hypothetical protein